MVNKDAKVRVYSTATCPWCHTVKDFLKKNKVKFEDIDVGEDRAAAQEMIDKSGQMGVPVVEIDGKIVIGYDEEKIKKLLDIQ